MSTTILSRLDKNQDPDQSASVARSEPEGERRYAGMTYEIGGVSPDLGP
jgi:hypothetical protein